MNEPNCQAEMYARHVACCPLVSHSEYADGTDGRADARPLHMLCAMDVASVIDM